MAKVRVRAISGRDPSLSGSDRAICAPSDPADMLNKPGRITSVIYRRWFNVPVPPLSWGPDDAKRWRLTDNCAPRVRPVVSAPGGNARGYDNNEKCDAPHALKYRPSR
jgi:hypothetical protein